MAETKDKLITAESLKYVHDSLSEKIVDKESLSLGLHTDGLVYIFVDGLPIGYGVSLLSETSGDIVGNIDSDNNIVLSGNLESDTYTIKYEMDDGSIIDIGELVLDNSIYYSITNNLTNCSSSNNSTSVIKNGVYSTTITADNGYELSSVTVSMNGKNITESVYTNGNINITDVTGNITIVAIAEETSISEPTNFFDASSGTYGRIGSDGANRTDATQSFITNYIEVQNGDIITISGCDIGGIISGTNTYYMACYNSSKTKLFAGQSDASNTYFTRDSYTNKNAQLTIISDDVAYLRFTCSHSSASNIMVDTNAIVINIKRNSEWL